MTTPTAGSWLSKTGASLTGTAEPAATVQITDADGAVVATALADDNGIWSATVAGPLRTGELALTVTDTDPKGTSTTVTYNVEPDRLVVTGPLETETVGKTNITLTGTAEPGATVRIRGAHATVNETAVAGEDGTWTARINGPLTAGQHELAITDDLRHAMSWMLTVDSDAVTITEPAAGTVLPKANIPFAGSAEPGTTVEITDRDGHVVATSTADASGLWTAAITGPLPAGDASFTVSAGSKSVSRDYTVASDALIISSPTAGTAIDKTGTTFTGTAEPGVTVRITDTNGTALATGTADTNGTWNAAVPGPLPAGRNTFIITDGEHSTSFDADVAADPVVITSPAGGAELSKRSIPFAGTAEPGATVQITATTGTVVALAVADTNGTWNATVMGPLAAGETTFSASDGTSTAQVTAAIAADPTVITSPSPGSTLSSTDASFAGTAEPGTTVRITDTNGAVIAEGTADANGNWTAAVTGQLTDGETSVTVNDGTNAFTVDVVIAPAVAPKQDLIITAPTAGSTVNTSNVFFEGTATPGATIQITDANKNVVGTTTADNSGAWSVTITGPLPEGPTALGVSDGTTSMSVDYLATDSTEGTPMLNSLSAASVSRLLLTLGALSIDR
ncbi:Ig-like domain-containing protein [Microbacterium testaceum]|uniref:Ig-like domain-containing protein n=1 Tax=Microbacterium testaceum TaxID=2033 RepID=UPI002AC496F2|nr:Ig-like domain-containing protein [Microbacterium testaceum]MDZ5145667.1 Ig-like domain-containing protein [Microbacterium testaceum]